MTTVRINTAKPYDVIVGRELVGIAGSLIRKVTEAKKALLVTDDTVDRLYGNAVFRSLEDSGFSVTRFVFSHGEQSKNITTLAKLLECAAEALLERRDIMVALGGGVTGDLTGFAASVYMRGIGFVQIPTTLLAAADASVGGKTAVDLEHGKNLAGTFWQPSLVICDAGIIEKLPSDIFGNGMAEVIKHGVIGDSAVLDCITDGTVMSRLEWLLLRNIEIKCGVVERDERENGCRKILNFGHTVAHAIEKTSGYTVSHGVAVGTGMVMETKLAARLGLCGESLADMIAACCSQYGLYRPVKLTTAFVEAMKLDKKNEGDDITFVLPRCLGHLTAEKLSLSDVTELLES